MASVANLNELGDYTLNPRGNLWVNDESSFGQKMLMKMGWSKGKGLGKNEDGIKENLKVKFKCTNAGLGYKDQSYDNVMKGEYESILKKLSAEYSQNNIHKNDDETKKSKQKSKTVKRKIRYPKLFYGKDVRKYSEKDMKSIFLCSLPSQTNEDKEIKSNNTVSSCLEDSKKELPKLLDSYNSQLSASDYFTLKMEQKKGNKVRKEPCNEMNQDYPSINVKKELCNELNQDYPSIKVKKELCNEINQDYPNVKVNKEPCNELNQDYRSIKVKKEPCNEINQDYPSVKVNKEPCNELNQNYRSIKVKKEPCNEINQDYPSIINNESENTVVIPDKKKSLKRKKNLINLDENLLNLEENDTECSKSTLKKRQKISEDLHAEGFSENSNLEMINSVQNIQSLSASKKRKKSHKLEHISSTNNDAASNDSNLSLNVLPPPNKKRKKVHSAKTSEIEESVELLSVNALKPEMFNENKEDLKLGLNVNEAEHESSNNNPNTKKSMKLKNKLKTLKSCLKSKRSKFTFKNVSFNENISYKIINSRYKDENETPITIDIDQCDLPTEETGNNCELQIDSNGETSVQSESFSTENGNSDICSSTVGANSRVKTEYDGDEHSETNLPSSKSSHYNSWIESQKLALKMKMYKSMLKNIRKHVILKTTNMLSLKGYGNWGFK